MTAEYEEVRIVTPAGVQAKHYGYILRNGVKVTVIHDPNAKMPAAAMSIRAGQVHDPPSLPGLAHFCEHMLFMGTAKFPREDEYQSFVSQNSGYTNAWTSDSETTYYFTVASDALVGALERFVEFFVAPSFNVSALEREVQAVHSEDEKNRTIDHWRIDEIDRSHFDPRHPRSRYGNGNIVTLRDEPNAAGTDVRAELLRFFAAHYVAGAASFAVLSAMPPADVLRVIMCPLMRMPPSPPPALRFLPLGDDLFATSAQRAWVNVRTLRRSRVLRVQWAVASPAAQWRTLPGFYASHIVGHECNTSVIGVLRRENWATELLAGPRRLDEDYEVFSVAITLTPEGMRRIVDVVDVLYAGIGLVTVVDATAYSQLKAEMRLAFESSEVGAAHEHCAGLAGGAHEADLRHCWAGGEFFLSDDTAAAERYAAQLTPEKAIITFLWGDVPCAGERAESENNEGEDDDSGDSEESEEDDGGEAGEAEAEDAGALFQSLPDFARVPCDQATRFHHTRYAKCRIPDAVIAQWAASRARPSALRYGLALPPLNPFLAAEFTRHETEAALDMLRAPCGVTRVRCGGLGGSFRASIVWRGRSCPLSATPLGQFYGRVMCNLFNETAAELNYFGVLAALDNVLRVTTQGLCIDVAGPQERLAEFFLAVFERALTPSLLAATEVKYINHAEAARRKLASAAVRPPSQHVVDRLTKATCVVHFTFDEILRASSTASYAGYTKFLQEFMTSGLYYECFVAGNVPSVAWVQSALVDCMEKKMQQLGMAAARREEIPRIRDAYAFAASGGPRDVPCISLIQYPPFAEPSNNVAVLLDLYMGPESPKLRACCDCLQNLLESSFFATLRSREALGYVVNLCAARHYGAAHLRLIVQSAVLGVDGLYLLSRVLAFIVAVENQFDAICTDADVARIASGLVDLRRKLPDTAEDDTADLATRHAHPAGLEHKEKEIAELERVDAAAVRALFLERVANSSPTRQALAIVVHSSASASSDELNNCGAEWRVLQLPPKRPAEVAPDAGADAATEEITLPDFVKTPMQIAVKAHASPAEYCSGFSILRSKVI